MLGYPKWKNYTLGGWEQFHIFKDPPKAIHTRKSEKVEMGDVTFNIRSEADRTSDAISYYARGVNPMVSISYNNTSGGQQASLPYKVAKDGAFRPPMYRQEDLLPLSRLRRDPFSVTSNPGSSMITVQNSTEAKVDKQLIKGAIIPNATYLFAGNVIDEYDRSAGCLDMNRNIHEIRTQPVTSHISSSQYESQIEPEFLNIELQEIRQNPVTLQSVNFNVEMALDRDLELQRKMDAYSVTSNPSMNDNFTLGGMDINVDTRYNTFKERDYGGISTQITNLSEYIEPDQDWTFKLKEHPIVNVQSQMARSTGENTFGIPNPSLERKFETYNVTSAAITSLKDLMYSPEFEFRKKRQPSAGAFEAGRDVCIGGSLCNMISEADMQGKYDITKNKISKVKGEDIYRRTFSEMLPSPLY